MPSIVTVNVSITAAPTPATLQQTGALISQGATVLSPNTYALLTQPSDLTPLLVGAKTLTSLSWAATVVTATAPTPHGFTIGDTLLLTITGTAPLAYSGTFPCLITGASTFTYSLAVNPGSATVPGAYTPEDVAELNAMVTTFFGQGFQVGVYVMELGNGTPAEGVSALTAYITANPNASYTPGATGYFYSYLVPRTWASEPSYISMLAAYEAPTAKTYFYTTANLQNYKSFTDLMKDAFVLIEAPQTHVWPANALTSLTYNTGDVALAATVVTGQSGSGSYGVGDTLTAIGGTGDAPVFEIVSTKVISATVDVGGTGGTNGTQTVTGVTTGATYSVTVAGGIMTAVISVLTGGAYTTTGAAPATEDVTGAGLADASLTIKMGVNAVTVQDGGALTVVPANPVSTTSSGPGTGATLTISWLAAPSAGYIIADTTTAHGVSVGDWFQLTGCTPVGYNGFYQAAVGTTGSALVAAIGSDPGAETVLGTLLQSNNQSAGVPLTEFSLAAPFQKALAYLPSTTNRVTPFAFSFTFGTTPFPTQSNNALLTTIKNANVNYISTGAEGGLTNTILLWGTTMDGRDLTYWYSVDWAQINADLNLSNAVINGSNNPLNPLYYDQTGINRLQDVAAATMNSAVSFGLANGTVTRTQLTGQQFTDALNSGAFNGQIVVNAVPLVPYLTASPSDYKIGRYAGLSVLYIPNRGFVQIVFNLNVTDFLVT